MQRSLALVSTLLLSISTTAASATEDIRLVVQITVDGLRGDLISRYQAAFGGSGFNRLIENGVWYTDAHHRHANTETIVGHATLATGAHPSEHGMIGNAWFNRAEERLGYNIEDPDYPMLPVPGFGGNVDQVDPTQAAAATSGRSPVNLLATTFGDELVKANVERSKVFSVSGKDRSAVAMAGHSGKAFWLSTATGAFETSEFYYDAYPDWVLDWNSKRPADAKIESEWWPECSDAPYIMERIERSFVTNLGTFGRTFPHFYGKPDDGLYYTQVLLSPHGDRITADFAKTIVKEEGLGDDEWPDYLSVSFSGVDATNHFFGPSSLENEEMVRCLDETLADFIEFMDREVGRANVLYVLSADHGMPEAPEEMAEAGLSTFRNSTEALMMDVNSVIADEFGVEAAIQFFFRPYVYLDNGAIEASGVDRRAIERRIVNILMAASGIELAMPTEPLAEQRGHTLQEQIRRNYHPTRSGDIYVVQTPYSFLFEDGPIAAMHGSPWRYDTHVPIIFAGPGIKPTRVNRPVSTVDVAVTLSTILGISQPSSAAGQALSEIGVTTP
ncbi:alkaline phosphatase family protein [Ruegeria atlantica]|uniref:Alkaline phosphatase family protein n=1 Tax=Ruegeria atlantica TaxID=81569 RepID=A0AA90Z377_9RHOB|nr:alkaline phosphatase family protein [Ruegeria atlantica]NOE19117.1 alkaline phosphatase family protein [Ruegeria atlantica]